MASRPVVSKRTYWPSRSGAVPDTQNLRRTPDTTDPLTRVSCFGQVNISPQLWELAGQEADAYDVNAARSMSNVSSVVPACTLSRTPVCRTVALTP